MILINIVESRNDPDPRRLPIIENKTSSGLLPSSRANDRATPRHAGIVSRSNCFPCEKLLRMASRRHCGNRATWKNRVIFTGSNSLSLSCKRHLFKSFRNLRSIHPSRLVTDRFRRRKQTRLSRFKFSRSGSWFSLSFSLSSYGTTGEFFCFSRVQQVAGASCTDRTMTWEWRWGLGAAAAAIESEDKSSPITI